jgi:hypothetical protein
MNTCSLERPAVSNPRFVLRGKRRATEALNARLHKQREGKNNSRGRFCHRHHWVDGGNSAGVSLDATLVGRRLPTEAALFSRTGYWPVVSIFLISTFAVLAFVDSALDAADQNQFHPRLTGGARRWYGPVLERSGHAQNYRSRVDR